MGSLLGMTILVIWKLPWTEEPGGLQSMGSQWRRPWHPTPALLPGKSHGRRSLVGCSPWGCKELDTTERLHFHFSLSCIGEGNGNPLQCSYLENPRDGGAWWAAVSGVAKSQIRLKWLNSSSSILVIAGISPLLPPVTFFFPPLTFIEVSVFQVL